MSLEEYKKLRRQLKYIVWLLVVFFLMLLGSIVLVSLDPQNKTFPTTIIQQTTQGLQGLPGAKGDTVVGAQGIQGTQGLYGEQGAQGTQGIQGIQGDPGAPGEQGTQGEPGEPGQSGREIELRTNPNSLNIEWRYVGDSNWHILISLCQIQGGC